jgi:hypothetical protein
VGSINGRQNFHRRRASACECSCWQQVRLHGSQPAQLLTWITAGLNREVGEGIAIYLEHKP